MSDDHDELLRYMAKALSKAGLVHRHHLKDSYGHYGSVAIQSHLPHRYICVAKETAHLEKASFLLRALTTALARDRKLAADTSTVDGRPPEGDDDTRPRCFLVFYRHSQGSLWCFDPKYVASEGEHSVGSSKQQPDAEWRELPLRDGIALTAHTREDKRPPFVPEPDESAPELSDYTDGGYSA